MRLSRSLWVVVGLLALSGLALADDKKPVKPDEPETRDEEDFTAGHNGAVPEDQEPYQEPPSIVRPPSASDHVVRVSNPNAHPEGEYGGVTPGQARPQHESERPKKARKPVAPNTVTWIGFQAQAGAPLVFVQISSSIAPEQKVDGKTLVVRLPGAKLARTRNLSRFIDTRYFKTDVTRIDTKAEKGGVTVRVSFKEAARQAKVDTQAGENGGTQVLFSF